MIEPVRVGIGHERHAASTGVSLQKWRSRFGKAPKQAATPEFAAVANYGYHLDAGKFGLFLRKHCLEHLGVRYVPLMPYGYRAMDAVWANVTEAKPLPGDARIATTPRALANGALSPLTAENLGDLP